MKNLAEVVLDDFWFLNFSEEDEADLDTTVKLMEDLVYRIETQFTQEERNALQEAARHRLQHWLSQNGAEAAGPHKIVMLANAGIQCSQRVLGQPEAPWISACAEMTYCSGPKV